MNEKAVVLLSGGQDSATCLALASTKFRKVYAVSFDYGQRHRIELKLAGMLSRLAGCKNHVFVQFPSLAELDQTSTMLKRPGDTRDVSEAHPIHKHLPSSFLPGRNYMLLGLAAVYAFNIGAETIFTGTCQTDFSGYPDCRREAIDAIEEALRIAMDFPHLEILTPLMFRTKAETVLLMQSLGHLDWYAHTQTCYNGKRPPCNTCPACVLRAKGFAEAGIHDPLMDVGITG
jgi:7-cyano-7-deazaguanine synthase